VSKVNLIQLSFEIRGLERHQSLYRVLKSELSRLGYWKNKKRGKLPLTRLIGR